MLGTVFISVLFISSVMSMTTTPGMATTKAHHHHPHNGTHQPHSPKPSHEPAEHENFRFSYEPITQKMVIVSTKDCYIFTLTDSEKSAIHTDAGMRAVELKLLSSLSTANVSEVTRDSIDRHLARACAHALHIYQEATV